MSGTPTKPFVSCMEFTDLVNMFFSVGAKEKHDEVYGIKLNFKYVTTTNTLGR